MINFDFDMMNKGEEKVEVQDNIVVEVVEAKEETKIETEEKVVESKKDIITLYENEVLCEDVDDEIESELSMFHDKIKDIDMERIGFFKNWFYVYKVLNYDIFENLKITNVYKYSRISTIVELEFNGTKEYDLLTFIENDMTVSVVSVIETENGYSAKNRNIRRKLIPTTPEEALTYAKKELDSDDAKAIQITIDEIMKNITTYKLNKNLSEIIGVEIKSRTKRGDKMKTNKVEEVVENKEETKIENSKVETEEKVVENKVEEVVENKEEIVMDTDYFYSKAIEYIKDDKVELAKMILETEIYKDIPSSEVKEIFVDSFIKGILVMM